MRALITGASSGIGRDMARELAARGYDLILVARRRDRLEEIAAGLPVDCAVIPADLGDIEECKRVFAEAAEYADLELVINNAGFGLCGRFAELDLDHELDMIRINVIAVHVLTKLFVRAFRKKGSGRILNVASSAGFMPGPMMAAYYATKNYVLRLTQAVAEELRRDGSAVRVCALAPGPVDTEFNTVAGVRFALPGLSSAECAKCAIDGVLKGKTVIIPGWYMKLSVMAGKLTPEWLLPRITYSIQRKKVEKN